MIFSAIFLSLSSAESLAGAFLLWRMDSMSHMASVNRCCLLPVISISGWKFSRWAM
uniref:Uncharacterized protein n=1 Tax=Arundo donax TaxID=35708 RepID=A0A0A9B716_ARUDO